MTRKSEARPISLARVLLLVLVFAPVHACRDHDLLAPPRPPRAIPKPNRTLSTNVAVASPVDMNVSGAVAGITGYGNQVHAALSIDGVVYDLGAVQTPDASSTYAAGINNRGQVVGTEYDDSAAPYGFLWTPDTPNATTGTMQRVDGPNGPAQPLDINDAGEILGTHFDGTGVVLWSGGSVVELPSASAGGSAYPRAINAYGQIAGTVYDASGMHAFLWTPAEPNGSSGSYVLLDAAGGAAAASLNDFGQIAVTGGDGTARLWTPTSPNGTTGGFTAITSPFGQLTAVDINSRGDVLSSGPGPYSDDCGWTTHLYLWRPTVANGSAGGVADVTTDIGGTGGWGYPVNCWVSGTFLSEEEGATIQAFGQVTDSYSDVFDEAWTLSGLDAPVLSPTIYWGGAPNEGVSLYFDGGLNNPYSIGWTYQWDFGDGTTAFDRIAAHAYADNGQYTVRLTVSDATGASNATSTTISVANLPPTGTLNFAPQFPGEGSTYVLSVGQVSDSPADLPTLQLALDCGDGRGYQSVALTGTLACSAPNETVRTAHARLGDKDGGITEYAAPITVVDVAPTVAIMSAPATISDQTTYTISFKFSDPGALDTWTYSINWGDNTTTGPISVSAQGGTLTASHRYTVNRKGGNKSATYTVGVSVADNGGATGFASAGVLVTSNGYHP